MNIECLDRILFETSSTDWVFAGEFESCPQPNWRPVRRAVYSTDLSITLDWCESSDDDHQFHVTGVRAPEEAVQGMVCVAFSRVRVHVMCYGLAVMQFEGVRVARGSISCLWPNSALCWDSEPIRASREIGLFRLVNSIESSTLEKHDQLTMYDGLVGRSSTEDPVKWILVHRPLAFRDFGSKQTESARRQNTDESHSNGLKPVDNSHRLQMTPVAHAGTGGSRDRSSVSATTYDPTTIAAVRLIAQIWGKPWPEFFDEFRERAERHGVAVDRLALSMASELDWESVSYSYRQSTKSSRRRRRA